ncbi:MAG: holo-ACP synthase [Marinobacterium sp.]|nr:holo-ACP synthase [Marinobacterium sp.]
MIAGIGTDILQISRITSALARTPRLAERVLTPPELERFERSKDKPRFLAKRFAAKEAAAKALGTGIGRGVSWQHMEVRANQEGRPLLHFCEGALLRAQALGAQAAHISYSDEREYVVAFVILDTDCPT